MWRQLRSRVSTRCWSSRASSAKRLSSIKDHTRTSRGQHNQSQSLRNLIFLRNCDFLQYLKLTSNIIIMQNKVHSDCFLHNRSCDSFCTYSQCQVKIVCSKCVTEHLQIHPRNFIYKVQNLREIHGFDKLGRLKQELGRQKMENENKLASIYQSMQSLLAPLINRLRQFQSQSKELAVNEFLKYLAKNKTLIETCKVIKSDPKKTQLEPELLIEETINQVSLVNSRQEEMKKNTEIFTLYINSVEQMKKSVQLEINSAVEKILGLFENCIKIQADLFKQKKEEPEKLYFEFFKDYINTHLVASKVQNNSLELALLEYKKKIEKKDDELNFYREEIKSYRMKAQQMSLSVQRLKLQIQQLKSKQEREEREKREAISVGRQKMQEYLIKNSFALTQARCISVSKKPIDEKLLDVLLSFIKNPQELILSQHELNKEQLQRFILEPENEKFSLRGIKSLKMSFMPIDTDFLKPAFQFFKNLHTLQLNSCSLDDSNLEIIVPYFPQTLKHLYLMDNQLMDQGLERMLMTTSQNGIAFESLFLSYNKFSEKAIDAISFNNPTLKTLHISKNQIKNKGATSISKFLHNLQELFIGGTGVTKDGILSISKALVKLKRLSLVATDITTDVISEILLNLHKLQWLDISYSSLTEMDLMKVEKLKVFNKKIEIVAQT